MASEQVKNWAGAHENYTLRDTDGKTEVSVDMDTNEEIKEMLESTWPQALNKLKELVEK